MSPADVLKELFDLLENYAPTWYTDEHRNQALQSLIAANVKLSPATRSTLRRSGTPSCRRPLQSGPDSNLFVFPSDPPSDSSNC